MSDGIDPAVMARLDKQLKIRPELTLGSYQPTGSYLKRDTGGQEKLWGYELRIYNPARATQVNGEIVGCDTTFMRTQAEALDGHYLLFLLGGLFGVSDTREEADKRMRDRLSSIARNYENADFTDETGKS